MFSSHVWSRIRWLYLRMRALLSHIVDRALGVRTTMDETARSGQPFDPTKKPSGWLTLYRVFHWLEVGPNDVIVDIGSGAGRAVLVASLFPFRRVIGLERLDSLHELAKRNLKRFRIRPRTRVEFVLGDALDYELPDAVTVVFFYNLFAGQTFELFMQRVIASVDRSPRRLRLVYVNPKEHGYLVETGRCRLVKRFRGLRPTREWARALATHIYEVESHSSLSEARTESHTNHPSGHFHRATGARFQGPVLFKQKRYGLGNQIINVWKFRTMYHDQADQHGVQQIMKDDPRVTRVGALPRRWSLDELPQLMNVLLDEMSIIGPRPHPLLCAVASRLSAEVVDEYAAPHRVEPGRTGWAQLHGWYGAADSDEKICQRVSMTSTTSTTDLLGFQALGYDALCRSEARKRLNVSCNGARTQILRTSRVQEVLA